MATLTKADTKKEAVPPVTTEIDMVILEHIYSAKLEDILADDALITVIMSNGYYQCALCEVNEYDTMEIKTKEGKTEILYGPTPNMPPIINLVTEQTKITTPGLTVKNYTDPKKVDNSMELQIAELNATQEMISMGKYGDIPISNDTEPVSNDEGTSILNE